MISRRTARSGAPEADFNLSAKEVSAREYCNLHGLWKSQAGRPAGRRLRPRHGPPRVSSGGVTAPSQRKDEPWPNRKRAGWAGVGF
ncbi:MAG TPA: desulfoferrodoxin family protein [Phycisphaerae bacterium]|nr:desulfoferrodoxin family protein [Phycisphaerae bacterium]